MNKAAIIDGIGRIPVLGNILRRFARVYREESVVTIGSGHLAGYKWMRSHRYVNGYWLGIYELAIQDCLVRELKPNDVFYDIGANAGFFTLLGSKCVGPEGKVFSFEPLPENIQSIRSQLELNAVTNCSIVEAAVIECQGTVEFCQGRDTSTAHIRQEGGEREGVPAIAVKAIRLDDFILTSPAPDFIKVDIEGAELLALKGAVHLLGGDTSPKMLIEFHSEQLAKESIAILSDLGYKFYSLNGDVLDVITTDRHILCVPYPL